MGQNDSTKKLDLWDSTNYEGGTFIYGISDLMIKEQRNCKHCVLCEGPILASYAVWECSHLSVRNGFLLKRHVFRSRIQILIPRIVIIVVRWITLHGWKCVFRNLFWNNLAFLPTLLAFPLSLSLVSSVIHQPSETSLPGTPQLPHSLHFHRRLLQPKNKNPPNKDKTKRHTKKHLKYHSSRGLQLSAKAQIRTSKTIWLLPKKAIQLKQETSISK